MGLPLIMAMILTLVPADKRAVFRWGAMLSTLASMLLAVYVFAQFDAVLAASQDSLEKEYGYAFTQRAPWIDSLNISFHVGVDGIGVVMVLMASIVAFAAACCAGEIKAREKEFTILLLLMAGGILGAFMSLDVFQMYFLHELALVPTFIMIGVWGRGKNRDYAAYKITLYLSLGALIALAGLILLYMEFETFSLLGMLDHLHAQQISTGKQNLIFALLMFGLGILVSLWPFHTWAPLGYGAAPTPTARRTFSLGRMLRKFIDQWDENKRVAILASGCFAMDVGGPLRGWTDDNWVGTVTDLLENGKYESLARRATAQRMAEAGNNSTELLNWIGLTGAVGENRPLFVENDEGSGYAVWDLEGGRK